MRFGGKIIPDNFYNERQTIRPAVAIVTLGCKLNQAESETLSRQLHESGYRMVSSEDKADVYILNTCTVTHVADRKSRHLLRMAHRRNPEAKIIVMGCYAERAAKELSDIEGITLVVDNSQKAELNRLLDNLTGRNLPCGTILAPEKPDRTRSFIKAQDGCNNFCTYCIVPLVRGRENSLPLKQVIDQIKLRVIEGYQEVVLTGTEIGRYLYDSINLTQLIKHILNETEISRLRLSSLQPQEISDELLNLWRNPRLCRHFHLSLQSGSDGVLRRMNRQYSAGDYQETVRRIRSTISDVAITTDVIVGFPGETRAEFSESYEFCRMIGFTRIHVFPYSIREDTQAARMPEQIEPQVKKKRLDTMLHLAMTSQHNFYRGFLGQTLPVLLEQKSGTLWSGLTDNYIKVYVGSNKTLSNRFLPVELVKLMEDGVQGVLKE